MIVVVSRVASRSLGLVVPVALLAVGTHFFADGIADAPLLGERDVDRVADWLARPHGDAAELLAGTALVALALLAGWELGGRRLSRPFLVVRRRPRTTVDRRRLARSLERVATTSARGARSTVSVRPGGRTDTTVWTDDPSPDGTVGAVRAGLERAIAERGLPCSVRRVVARPLRRSRSRVR
ncbi:MAG: hypothetical protein AB7H43_07330 [Acidimicrobiia bacterium]